MSTEDKSPDAIGSANASISVPNAIGPANAINCVQEAHKRFLHAKGYRSAIELSEAVGELLGILTPTGRWPGVLKTPIWHSHNADGTQREKHCCGCWDVSYNDDGLNVVCNECGEVRDVESTVLVPTPYQSSTQNPPAPSIVTISEDSSGLLKRLAGFVERQTVDGVTFHTMLPADDLRVESIAHIQMIEAKNKNLEAVNEKLFAENKFLLRYLNRGIVTTPPSFSAEEKLRHRYKTTCAEDLELVKTVIGKDLDNIAGKYGLFRFGCASGGGGGLSMTWTEDDHQFRGRIQKRLAADHETL
jgi:hypothetical protein